MSKTAQRARQAKQDREAKQAKLHPSPAYIQTDISKRLQPLLNKKVLNAAFQEYMKNPRITSYL